MLGEINAVHPFREGNGRTQLAFLTLLAESAGFEVNDDVLDPQAVINAMVTSFAGDEARLAVLVEEAIGDQR